MSVLDLIMMLFIFAGVARGAMTGGVKQVFGLVGLVISFVVAAKGSEALASQLEAVFGISEVWAPILSFILIFALIEGVAYVVARLIESFLNALKLNVVNRILGGIVGGFKAVLVLSLVLFLLGYINIPSERARENSALYKRVYPILPETWNYVTGRVPGISL